MYRAPFDAHVRFERVCGGRPISVENRIARTCLHSLKDEEAAHLRNPLSLMLLTVSGASKMENQTSQTEISAYHQSGLVHLLPLVGAPIRALASENWSPSQKNFSSSSHYGPDGAAPSVPTGKGGESYPGLALTIATDPHGPPIGFGAKSYDPTAKIAQGFARACPQLSRMIAATNWTAARKFRASLS
jgi:hypothetical protein